MTGKTFDCVEMKRRAQREIHRETRGMTTEERLTYFRHAAETGPLGEWWHKVRAHGAASKAEAEATATHEVAPLVRESRAGYGKLKSKRGAK